MELFAAGDKYILQDGESGLWCDRKTGALGARQGEELCDAWNPTCLGTVFGILGKVKILADSHSWLLLISGRQRLESADPNINVYKITKILVLPLSMASLTTELDIAPCQRHGHSTKVTALSLHAKKLQKFGFSLKAAMTENVASKKVPREIKMKDKLEKRIVEELCKMFNYSENYFYSDTFDITNCMQRRHASTYDCTKPLWMRADDRFFWNRELLGDLIDSKLPLVNRWIVPCIQGYYECKAYRLSEVPPGAGCPLRCCLALISRRSRYRAGTRYRRRGVDEHGCCANYVETEQVLTFQDHSVSFLQVRGSIPVYWSQPGNNYRPVPVLDKGEEETARAFEQHFSDQLKLYKKVTAINLAEMTGREKIVTDAYLHHILIYNNPAVAFVAFDFHEYCRGLMFGNIHMLIDAIQNLIKEQKYCWVDAQGMIAEQHGIFRVNCIDSLDRTNVAQTAIARAVLETQIRKFGLLSPDNQLPDEVRRIFNELWANNGDAISRQYAGTAALKGDFTRTGERKFSGLMKDGMKSANRYIMHLFRDIYRQAAIDVQVGNSIDDLVATIMAKGRLGVDAGEEERAYLLEKACSTPAVIEEARTMLVVEPEVCMGGWALINYDEGYKYMPDAAAASASLTLSRLCALCRP